MSTSSAKIFGLLAEFESAADIYHACENVRDAGFSRWDAHTPFPVHGLDRAMGLKPTRVSLFSLILGLSGAAGGMLMQWWISAVDYPVTVSGKPFFSWPAFVPIMFELSVLGGATGAVLGFLILARLPQHYHSLFRSKRFERASDDRFFISIEATDPKFDREKTASFLSGLGATHVEIVED